MGEKPEVLDAVLKETVDLENIPIEEVFENLRCTKEGLTSEAAEERLTIFGHNKLEEKKESKFLKFLGFMWNPLSWVMEAAAIMAIALANGGNKPPDWQDFVGIITLLVINSTISFIEENNAGNAAAALMARLAPKAKVLRNGRWSEEDASILVPRDVISIKLGDIIPADSRLLEGDPLKIDQSALTGESLPITKGSRLQNLVNNLISVGSGREAAFAAALLGDNVLMEKAWQDTGMLAEAVLHAHESGKDSQDKKKNLRVAATDCEPLYLIRLLQTNLCVGSGEQTLLEALGHASVYWEKHSTHPAKIESNACFVEWRSAVS